MYLVFRMSASRANPRSRQSPALGVCVFICMSASSYCKGLKPWCRACLRRSPFLLAQLWTGDEKHTYIIFIYVYLPPPPRRMAILSSSAPPLLRHLLLEYDRPSFDDIVKLFLAFSCYHAWKSIICRSEWIHKGAWTQTWLSIMLARSLYSSWGSTRPGHHSQWSELSHQHLTSELLPGEDIYVYLHIHM